MGSLQQDHRTEAGMTGGVGTAKRRAHAFDLADTIDMAIG
jgi:hypothetical protein